MAQFKNLMDVFKLLEKTNCRKCNEKTCLAFAAKVFQGDRPLSDCPLVPPESLEMHAQPLVKQATPEDENEKQLARLKAKLASLDFADTAQRIGAVYDGKKLSMKIMGKTFEVDAAGNIYTDIHVNPWVSMPIFNYILFCKGAPVTGQWVPLRELPSGKDWYRLFGQSCEKPLKRLADINGDLFSDLGVLFSGHPAENHHPADISLVLHPLPLVPLLLCYWYPEEGMESNLSLFFDATAEENLGIEGIYGLGTGITRMFEKLAHRHGGA